MWSSFTCLVTALGAVSFSMLVLRRSVRVCTASFWILVVLATYSPWSWYQPTEYCRLDVHCRCTIDLEVQLYQEHFLVLCVCVSWRTHLVAAAVPVATDVDYVYFFSMVHFAGGTGAALFSSALSASQNLWTSLVIWLFWGTLVLCSGLYWLGRWGC